MNTDTVLLLFAFVCFVSSTFQVQVKNVNLTAAGLALWVASLLF